MGFERTYPRADAAIAFADAWLGLRYFGERFGLERECHGAAMAASGVDLRSFDLDCRLYACEFGRHKGWIEGFAVVSI